MKIVTLVLATAIAAVIGSAPTLAQSPNKDTGWAPSSDPAMTAPTHPNPNQWARDSDRHGPPGWRRGGYNGWMCPWMRRAHTRWMTGGPGWMEQREWSRFHRHPRGAHFIFRRGNARIDIQCPANQNVKACADAASTLIDKVRGLGRHPAPPPPRSTNPLAGSKSNGATPGGAAPKNPPNRP